MTNRERLAILNEVMDRAYETLGTTPTEEMQYDGFRKLVESLSSMHYLLHELECSLEPEYVGCVSEAVPAPVQETAAPEKTVSEEVQPEPVVASPSADREETIKYDKPTVRAALQGLRQKGINANSIIQKLGYENFPAVPETKYAELMAAIEEAS
jgi:hypothetical protein